jgi:eukaryotic-like serine/threonine-protein kinase
VGLTGGTRLGHYEIQEPLGAGGMGEVYRARDTKLDREVAVKVLPDLFVRDPERVARFDREAKTLASLNHPNIAAIYGLETAGETTALVLELVDGPTLADRIAEGPIPLDEALGIARQIAEALEAAHEQGVVHRDLKPANIKLRPDGTVKVLDFGLAKALDPAATTSGSVSLSPTLTSPATAVGMILGTAAYMAPEQARGKPVDKRADVWAYGCVLFEMLTGKRAFEGQDVTDTIAAIVRGDPAWHALPADTPKPIHRLLRRCLAKDAKARLRELGSAIVDIDEARTAVETQPTAAPPVPSLQWWQRPRPAAVLVSAVAVLSAAIVSMTTRPAPAPRQVVRFDIPLGDKMRFSAPGRHVVALSPDGSRVAFVANQQIYLRRMDQMEAAPVGGTGGSGPAHGRSPFFSPDGQWLGFWAENALKRVSVTGGAPIVLCRAVNPWGASWGEDGTILFGQGPGGILRVPATGGAPEVVITVDPGEDAGSPQHLAGGDWVLFTLRPAKVSDWNEAHIVVQSLSTGERKVVLQGGKDARYVPTGHLVYARQGGLYAVPFDAGTHRVTGSAVAVVERVGDAANITGAAHFSISSTGTLAYADAVGQSVPLNFVWVDRSGREAAVQLPARPYQEFNLSPDGSRVAVRVADSVGELWVYDVTRHTESRLTFEAGFESSALWTPDGRRIAYGGPGIPLSWRAADGTGSVEVLAENNGETDRRPQAFAPDGSSLVFESSGKLNLLSLEKRSVVPLLDGETFTRRNAVLSPDGRWLAYESDESRSVEVYVRPFPDVNAGRWQVSSGGAQWPVWHPSGRELFYVSQRGLVAVSVTSTPGFSLGEERVLFATTPYSGMAAPMSYRRLAIAPDGQRFLFLKLVDSDAAGPAAQRLLFVANWFEELKHRVPR